MAKFILPTLAFVGAVLAQCDGPSITITTSADAAQIQNCQKYNGNIIIDPSASGSINLDGVRQITGDLTCKNATNLNSISASQLNTIAGTFDLEGLTVLSTLNFGSLTGVNRINWVGLPALQGLNFAQGVQQANYVYISNTQLNDLSGIELAQVGSMDINNNPYMNTINVNSLTNITTFLSFSANGQNLNVNFPNLQGAGNLTFRNVSSVAIPSLSSVGGSIGLFSDYFLNFSAPNLTRIGQALAIYDCAQLNSISFPQLTYIGADFAIVNNTNLKAINNIAKLKTVAGAIQFVGSFDVVDAAFQDVRGGSTVVTSSQNSSICNLFNNAYTHQAIKGSNRCNYSIASAVTNGTSGSNSGSSSNNKNAAGSLSFNPALPFAGLLGFLAWMLLL